MTVQNRYSLSMLWALAVLQAAGPARAQSPLKPSASLAGASIPAAAATSPAAANAAEAAAAMPVLPPVAENPRPMYAPETFERTAEAYRFYESLQAAGGWKTLPAGVTALRPGARGDLVEALKTRLALEGDLTSASDSAFDAATTAALKKYQSRHGLSETGLVGRLTLKALNVPIRVRLNQLAASLHRLNGNGFQFAERYVVVNVPGAAVEAVENGQVVQRHVAVVGRPDRPSPVLQARIQSVNLNPTWTAPTSIVKNDIMPKVRADPTFLFKNNMRILNGSGVEVDPNSVSWTGNPSFTVRQDGGPGNALGQVRIDMPNTEAVYMHDTPKQELFKSDIRFHSSGCARVEGVRDLAAWLLRDTQLDRNAIDLAISTGDKLDIKLPKSVPVAWVYLTGWASSDGSVQFRDDIYGLDTPDGITTSTIKARKAKTQPPPQQAKASQKTTDAPAKAAPPAGKT
ncbi:MAG: L,D-transpeptidase family protein [Beijerinckiaceae bacterium]|nr:L,D-transpeptidase family protein [Beijerinckiaceae bacterium]